MIRKLIKPVDVTDEAIDAEMIKTAGIGGQYLTQPKIFKFCRTEFRLTDFMNRPIMRDGKRPEACGLTGRHPAV